MRPKASNFHGELITATETKDLSRSSTNDPAVAGEIWQPFSAFRSEIDRIFDDLGGRFWNQPVRSLARLKRDLCKKLSAPAVDVTKSDNAYEITVELPNLDQKNIAVKLTHGGLTIRGDKRDETSSPYRTASTPTRSSPLLSTVY
ncbi:HSP20 family molecular chaperone IbpA [Bradyrhizobium yuanmingense]|uniref:Hsp20/alpha crystallin family protein n=1 Tax=Bradyrhizobium yuanmingense TaxID=108015 RepID=UPI0035979AFE